MSDVKLPVDFTVDERKSAWGLIYELFDMAPIDPTDQWKLAALLLRARVLTPKQAAAEEMYEALDSIAENLDPDSTDSDQYRNDDPEGAMDTCFSLAKAALAKAGQP